MQLSGTCMQLSDMNCTDFISQAFSNLRCVIIPRKKLGSTKPGKINGA